jgi:hypothetical protein
MSDKNLERRMNIKFYVKIGKGNSETLALLTSAYDVNAMKKSSVFECHRFSRTGEKICKMTQEVGIQKRRGQMQLCKDHEPWCP